MADSDQSLYQLRYNQISNNLEAFGGGSPTWTVLTLKNTDPTQVPVTRLINTTSPLMGGGNLSADRTLSIQNADTTHTGALTSTDWNAFNGKLSLSGGTMTGDLNMGGNHIRSCASVENDSGHEGISFDTGDHMLQFFANSEEVMDVDGPNHQLRIRQADAIMWGKLGETQDVGFDRNAAGIIEVNDGTGHNANGSLLASSITLTNPLNVVSGGTGLAALTAHSLVVGNGTSPATLVAPSSQAGMVLTSNGVTADPSYRPSGIGNIFTTAGSGTITPDASVANSFKIPVSGAVTVNGPSNPIDGQKITLMIHNDASHTVTLATGPNNFSFGTDLPSYTNSVSLWDYVGAIWNGNAGVWHVVSIVKGF